MGRWAKNPWVLGIAASVGAGVPPLVVPAGWPLLWRALIAAVVAGLAGASGSYFGVVLTRREEAAAARDALVAMLEPLDGPRPEPSPTSGDGTRSVLEALLPQWCPTRFWGRRAELDQWWEWCQDGAASGVLVLDGPGGCGKTRLALRAAGQVAAAGWVAGWVREGRAAELVDAVTAVTGGEVLALVDDAETHADLGVLLGALAGYRGRARLRVVLITRNGAGLVQALAGRIPERHAAPLKNATTMTLRPLGETGDLIRWYGEAVRAFAAARGTAVPPLSATVAPVRPGQTLMEVLAEAMTAVLRTAPPPAPQAAPTPADEVVRVLFEHEARWWRTTARLDRWGLRDATDVLLTRVMVALVLFAPTGEQAAARVLRRIPDLADAPNERVVNLVRWAHALYPPSLGAGMRIGPDLLTAWFVTTHLTGTGDGGEFAQHLLDELSEEQAGRVLTMLARAGEHHPPARLLFEQILGGDPVRLAHHAVHAALTTTRRHDLDHTTATALTQADLDPDTTARLTTLIPGHALPRCALALARHHVRHTRITGHPPDLARALVGLVLALYRVGEHEEEVLVAREVVALRRDLCADNPAYRSDLANALVSLGIALDFVGEHEELQQLAREAVALARDLSADDPAHRPSLARALGSLVVALDRVDELEEHLVVAREAVALCRELCADNPVHRSDLANALIGFARGLQGTGEYEELVLVAREAVASYRTLSADDPTHHPQLANALRNLAASLDLSGEHEEQLVVAREAVASYRDLCADNPAHRADLAHALVSLAVALDRSGERKEQLVVMREAVASYRVLTADNPTHRPSLARALRSLVVALGWVNEYEEHFAMAREAVALSRVVAADNPAHRADLAYALGSLAVALDRAGEREEQLVVAREAVALFRTLAADSPIHRPDLARALSRLATALERVGEYEEQLQAARESVVLFRDLAARHPKRFHQDYMDARGALQRRLAQRGDHDDAITLDL